MEQDIVNNLKSRVKKLEEELLRVVGIKMSECIVLLADVLLCCFSIPCVEWECTGLTHQVMFTIIVHV